MQTIFSFSVTKTDTESLRTIYKVKELCKKEGRSFSFVILQALRVYLKELS